MKRITLIHWNTEEAKQRISLLKNAGYQAVHVDLTGPDVMRKMKAVLPSAFVIDLTRLPSHGRDVGLVLRESKATRSVPLVFAGGTPEKIARVQQSLPDAVFTSWEKIRSALKNAIAHPLSNPVVPKTRLDGYSGTPLPKKLGIKPGYAVLHVDAPDDLEGILGDLPPDVELRQEPRGKFDLILWFVRSVSDLESQILRMARLAETIPIWIIWPKKSSGVASDLTEQPIRETGLACGLVDYKVCAVDATWSGLLFRKRK